MPNKCKFEDEIHQFSKPNVENSPKLNPIERNKINAKSKSKAQLISKKSLNLKLKSATTRSPQIINTQKCKIFPTSIIHIESKVPKRGISTRKSKEQNNNTQLIEEDKTDLKTVINKNLAQRKDVVYKTLIRSLK